MDEAQGFSASGLQNPAKMAADLGAMCSEDMEPPLRPLIRIHTFEEAQVLVAEVSEIDPAPESPGRLQKGERRRSSALGL